MPLRAASKCSLPACPAPPRLPLPALFFNSTIQTRRFPLHPSPSPPPSRHSPDCPGVLSPTSHLQNRRPTFALPRCGPGVGRGPPGQGAARGGRYPSPAGGGGAPRSWVPGRTARGPRSPLVVTSAGGAAPGPGHLESPLRREIGGCPARASRGKGVRREGPGLRPSSPRPALPCPPPWRRPRSDAPCARPAGRKLCLATSPARLTAPRGSRSAARPPGPRSPARDCGARQAPGARRAPPCASGRQDALRRPLGEPGFVGEPNFTLHLHLRLRLGDLAATDLVWQKLHQEVRKSERGRGVHGARGRTPGWRPQSRPGCPRAE